MFCEFDLMCKFLNFFVFNFDKSPKKYWMLRIILCKINLVWIWDDDSFDSFDVKYDNMII